MCECDIAHLHSHPLLRPLRVSVTLGISTHTPSITASMCECDLAHLHSHPLLRPLRVNVTLGISTHTPSIKASMCHCDFGNLHSHTLYLGLYVWMWLRASPFIPSIKAPMCGNHIQQTIVHYQPHSPPSPLTMKKGKVQCERLFQCPPPRPIIMTSQNKKPYTLNLYYPL
jgi:hypothetical protein